MKLDISEWKKFKLERLFDIRKGRRLTSDDQEEGINNYIGAIDSNNGIANHISQKPIHEANTISLSYNGSVGEAFYQNEPYWATDDVNALYSKYDKFNESIGLFIATVIRQEKYKFSYGRKWTLDNMNATFIRLPIQHMSDGTAYIDTDCMYSDEGYVPDWEYMELYIKSLKYKPLTTKNNSVQTKDLKINEWKEFKIGKFFTIKPTKDYAGLSNDDLDDGGQTPFIVNSAENNGIGGFSSLNATENKGIITFSDTTDSNTFFYQPNDFIGFAHVQGMYPKHDVWTRESMLFLTVLLRFSNRGLFNYGRKMRRDTITASVVKLPIRHNIDGTPLIDDGHIYSDEGYVPDWQYMVNYIKSLPYGDRLET